MEYNHLFVHVVNFKAGTDSPLFIRVLVVAGGGIEPPTQGFSVLCSTN